MPGSQQRVALHCSGEIDLDACRSQRFAVHLFSLHSPPASVVSTVPGVLASWFGSLFLSPECSTIVVFRRPHMCRRQDAAPLLLCKLLHIIFASLAIGVFRFCSVACVRLWRALVVAFLCRWCCPAPRKPRSLHLVLAAGVARCCAVEEGHAPRIHPDSRCDAFMGSEPVRPRLTLR